MKLEPVMTLVFWQVGGTSGGRNVAWTISKVDDELYVLRSKGPYQMSRQGIASTFSGTFEDIWATLGEKEYEKVVQYHG